MRINKYLASQNICSRREADALIEQGKVTINGQVAQLGDIVGDQDEVLVDRLNKQIVYYAYHKPKGITTHSPQAGEKSIENVTKFPQKVYPLGRLDKESRGLIILTNDGRATDKLLNPAHNHEKEYVVCVNKPVRTGFLKRMAEGVTLEDGYRTKKCVVNQKQKSSFMIILTEGKRRQIRRMCMALGYTVTDLKRIRIMNIQLQKLEPKQYRKISGLELKSFLNSLGLGSEIG